MTLDLRRLGAKPEGFERCMMMNGVVRRKSGLSSPCPRRRRRGLRFSVKYHFYMSESQVAYRDYPDIDPCITNPFASSAHRA